MGTTAVRKFAISVDPDEIVDFAESLSYFGDILKPLGFTQTTAYTWRYADNECVLKCELKSSTDGFEIWMYVQAPDEHQFRLSEVAEAFGAHVIDPAKRRAARKF